MDSALPAAVLAALAMAVLLGSPPVRRLRRLEERGVRSRTRGVPAAMGACGLASVWALFGWRVLGWAVAGTIIVATLAWVLREAARARWISRAQTETARAGSTVALLLASGRIPTEALREAAEDCPCLAPAAATVGLGGDVGSALLAGAGEPGRRGLAAMAAAWRVSERSGAPIAGVMAQVAESLRHEQQVADVVATELSAARTSGRIMALLPFAAIGLGMLVGADPLSFLFTEVLGQWLFLGGVALAAAGVVWTERIAGGPLRSRTRRSLR